MDVRLRMLAGAMTVMALGGCSLGSNTAVTRSGASSGSSQALRAQSSSTSSAVTIPAAQASAGAAIERSVNSPVTASGDTYPIASYVDGDTIKVLVNGKKQIVRLLGVDTPETKKPHTPVECYGEEASAHMKSLVAGKSVQLVIDPTQGATDKYGRWLRYVFVGGEDVGLSQIAGGFGREYTYDKAYQAQSAYREAQADAQSNGLGTWGSGCHGFHLSDGKVIAAAVKPSVKKSTSSSSLSTKSSQTQSNSSTSASAMSTASESAGKPSQQISAPSSAGGNAAGGLTSSAPGCQIKGNITGGRKLAHVPGDVGYARTKITPNTGERWFCSVADAEAAGWAMAK